jgi:signal transduction histidine kinase
VVVAAISAGLVAVLAVVLASEYRWRNFRVQSVDEARIALAFAPNELNAESFERLRLGYDARSEADIVAAGNGGTFSSAADIDTNDVPDELRAPITDDVVWTRDDVDGRPYLVVAGREGENRYWFFFSLRQVNASISEFTRVCALAWVATTILAGVVGRSVARRTLLPIRAVARASEAIADGAEDTRLPVADDEFGTVASSFNRMADEVQRRIADLERAATRERRFTADIAHDLRTPLTGMAATAALLSEQVDRLPAEARRPAELLMSDVHRLRSLVLELLELARLDVGADPVEPSRLHIGHAASAAARSLDAGALLDVEVDATPDAVAVAEPGRLARILANILGNAAAHGGHRVVVRAWRDGDSVVTTITDDGPGVPPGELERIFDRFAKSDRSRASGGSGLGLAIALAHAEAQRGTLIADNAPGGGARFTLRLPAASNDGE